MSKYSGKCDFRDTWEICDIENRIEQANIYVGNNIVPLRITSYKDAVPYFPRIAYAIGNENNGVINIWLGEKSYAESITYKPMKEIYLKELYDEMLKVGYEEDVTYKWVYGCGGLNT
jgi:hypothetical protein